MQISDEVVSMAIDTARKHAREVMGVACEIEPETMRVALEAALGARPKGDAPDLVVFFRRSADPTENEAAACIEDLAGALKEVISVSDRATDIYDRASATLERWGMK